MDRTTCHEGQSVRKLLDRALPVCFFMGLFVYVWMAIEPRLLYYGFGVFAEFPRFSWEGMFLKVSLSTPGGPLSLLVGFLAQWYYLSWLGAIIIIASLWVLFSGTRRLFQEVDADAGPDLAFVPPLLGVLILNRYDHPLQAVLAVAMSAWTAAVYLSLPLKGIAGRAVPFAFLYGLCYYVIGGPAVVFGLTACLAEGLSRRRVVSAAACAVLAVAATLAIGVWALSLDPHGAFRAATPFDPGAVAGLGRTSRWLLWGLYAFTPLAVAGTWAWGWLASRIALWRGQKRVSTGQPEVNRARPRRLWPRVGLRWLTVGVLCIACMADRHVGTKYGLAIHDLARQRQWSEVLRLADRMRGRYPLTPASIFEVDRAMAHLGRMGDDMFKYPHEARALAFLGSVELGLQLRFAKLIDLHFDLGDLNAAEQDAYELLEAQGPSPFILEALARVHMAKAEYEAASVVLRALQRSPAYRATASRWLEEIGQPSRLAVDVDIASWQRWRRRTDHEVRAVPYDQILLELLHDHPDNRMAFEYLTAYYLLRNMRAELVANLHRVRDLGYGHLPRHYAEALVVHLNQTRQPFDLQGWTLDPGLTDQLRQIVGTWKDTAGDRQAAMAALGPRFGDTYTFYSIFNISGGEMTHRRIKLILAGGLATCWGLAWLAGCPSRGNAALFDGPMAEVGPAQISPDYQQVTIPPNLAPLNFKVLTPGRRYVLRVRSANGEPIVVSSRTGSMRIPVRAWHALLVANKGQTLFFDLALQQKDRTWCRCTPISNVIGEQPIDRTIAYRLLRPQYNYFRETGVYQRDLEGFRQSLILHGRSFQHGCVNCHSFPAGDPNRMTLGIRSSTYGNSCLCIQDGQITKIGTKFGHTTWHPSGKLITYSIFDVRMFFHTARPEVHDVVEMDSMLAYYLVDPHKVKTAPVLLDRARLETQPSWGPDGRYLYFASAPKLWTDMKRLPPDRFADLQYDIQRVPYDVNTDTWGPIETVVSSSQVGGKSCLLPRVSPDGRFLLFTACDYGCFAIYQPSSDLYLKDLQTGEVRRLECNSDMADTWHTWSTNGRWIVFASKYPTGKFTRLYLSFIDDRGRASKPLVLPQKNPEFYDSFLYAYNVPELIRGPVAVDGRRLAEAVRSSQAVQVDALTAATVKAEPYKESVGQR